MPNYVPDLLPALKDFRLDGLDAGKDMVYPAYNGQSLVNLPSSIAHWLGAPSIGNAPLQDVYLKAFGKGQFKHVILLLVDGLGLNMFQRFMQADPWARWMPDAALLPLTSVVPSTTATALTTLWTGAAPAEHGVLGYEMWLREYSMIANLILHAPATFYGDVGGLKRGGFDPLTFLPSPLLTPHLAQYGIRTYSHQHAGIARSGLSTMLQHGAELLPYKTLNDLWVTLAGVLDAQRNERTYSWVYWGDLDELSHRFGPEDERVLLEFATFSYVLERFINKLNQHSKGDTLFLMTADHGHIHTPKLPAYDLANHPEMTDCLAMVPSGEARLPYVYIRPGREEKLRAYIEQTWPGMYRIFRSEDVLRAGLFGANPYARTPERLGDWVVVPQSNAYWWWGKIENPLLGRHGGLSTIEMLVPLFGMVM